MINHLPILVGSPSSKWEPECFPDIRNPNEYRSSSWDWWATFNYDSVLSVRPSALGTELGVYPYRRGVGTDVPIAPPPDEPQLCIPDGGVIQVKPTPPNILQMPVTDGYVYGKLAIVNTNLLSHPHRDDRIEYVVRWHIYGTECQDMYVLKYNFNKEGTRFIAVQISKPDPVNPDMARVHLVCKPDDEPEKVTEVNDVLFPSATSWHEWGLFITDSGQWGLRVQAPGSGGSFLNHYGDPFPVTTKVCKGRTFDFFASASSPIPSPDPAPILDMTALSVLDIGVYRT